MNDSNSGAPPPASDEEHGRAGTTLRQIVVPVKLPPGGNYEIVIRLELDTNP